MLSIFTKLLLISVMKRMMNSEFMKAEADLELRKLQKLWADSRSKKGEKRVQIQKSGIIELSFFQIVILYCARRQRKRLHYQRDTAIFFNSKVPILGLDAFSNGTVSQFCTFIQRRIANQNCSFIKRPSCRLFSQNLVNRSSDYI